eukprot:365502-Chlamydomonas_euryale.AAC.8
MQTSRRVPVPDDSGSASGCQKLKQRYKRKAQLPTSVSTGPPGGKGRRARDAAELAHAAASPAWAGTAFLLWVGR